MKRLTWLRRKALPSKALALYVMRLFLARFGLILFVLITLLQSLDMLNKSDDIIAVTNDSSSLITYVSLRLPELVSQFIPFAALLGALISFYSLAQNSEVVIMRASGLAPGQVVAPMLAATIVIAAAHLIFHDAVTVQASKRLKAWQDSNYTQLDTSERNSAYDIWLSDEDQIIEARSASRMGNKVILDQVHLYRRNSDSLLSESLVAEFALLERGRWTLYNVRRFDLNTNAYTQTERLPWSFDLTTEQIFAPLNRPEHARFSELSEAVALLKEQGGEVYALTTNWHHRVAQALSSVLMPLVALLVGFGLPRTGSRIGRVLIALGIGFGYFVVDNYMVAMGSLGILPPLLAAYSALAVFIMTSLSHLVRLD